MYLWKKTWIIGMWNVQDTGLQFFKGGILFKIQIRGQIGELSFALSAVHRNYIGKLRTSNIYFQMETKKILWNEYLCST